MIDIGLQYYNYLVAIFLMMLGFYTMIAYGNLVKKIIGLSIFQVSILLIYVSGGYVRSAAVPIYVEGISRYVNPLPHVLMLTAIVVGVSVMAVGLALIVRIKEAYGTIEEDEIIALDKQLHQQERQVGKKNA